MSAETLSSLPFLGADLRSGPIVIADNMYTAENIVQPYKQYIDENPHFSSMTLDFESGVEFTVVL